MMDSWTKRRNRPLRLLAVQLEKTEESGAQNREGKEEPLPFWLVQNGAKITYEELAGADILYLTASVEACREISALAGWARQKEILVFWNPGELKNARILPVRGCVILQSRMSAEEEWAALQELFCSPGLTTTLDRETLVQRLQTACRAELAMVQASGSGKKQNLGRDLTGQGWKMPREGTLVVSIGSSADCRLEEVVELWHGTVKRTGELDVLWGTSFNLERPDTLRLVLLAVAPEMPNG